MRREIPLRYSVLAWALIVALGLWDEFRNVVPDTTDTVPCSTDQDCAEKNPGVTGPYAFPEKSLAK